MAKAYNPVTGKVYYTNLDRRIPAWCDPVDTCCESLGTDPIQAHLYLFESSSGGPRIIQCDSFQLLYSVNEGRWGGLTDFNKWVGCTIPDTIPLTFECTSTSLQTCAGESTQFTVRWGPEETPITIGQCCCIFDGEGPGGMALEGQISGTLGGITYINPGNCGITDPNQPIDLTWRFYLYKRDYLDRICYEPTNPPWPVECGLVLEKGFAEAPGEAIPPLLTLGTNVPITIEPEDQAFAIGEAIPPAVIIDQIYVPPVAESFGEAIPPQLLVEPIDPNTLTPPEANALGEAIPPLLLVDPFPVVPLAEAQATAWPPVLQIDPALPVNITVATATATGEAIPPGLLVDPNPPIPLAEALGEAIAPIMIADGVAVPPTAEALSEAISPDLTVDPNPAVPLAEATAEAITPGIEVLPALPVTLVLPVLAASGEAVPPLLSVDPNPPVGLAEGLGTATPPVVSVETLPDIDLLLPEAVGTGQAFGKQLITGQTLLIPEANAEGQAFGKQLIPEIDPDVTLDLFFAPSANGEASTPGITIDPGSSDCCQSIPTSSLNCYLWLREDTSGGIVFHYCQLLSLSYQGGQVWRGTTGSVWNGCLAPFDFPVELRCTNNILNPRINNSTVGTSGSCCPLPQNPDDKVCAHRRTFSSSGAGITISAGGVGANIINVSDCTLGYWIFDPVESGVRPKCCGPEGSVDCPTICTFGPCGSPTVAASAVFPAMPEELQNEWRGHADS